MPRLSPESELLANSLRVCCHAQSVNVGQRAGLARILWRLNALNATVTLNGGQWRVEMPDGVVVTADAQALKPTAVVVLSAAVDERQLELELQPVTYSVHIAAQNPYGDDE